MYLDQNEKNEIKNEMIDLFNVGLVTPGTFRRQERFFNE